MASSSRWWAPSPPVSVLSTTPSCSFLPSIYFSSVHPRSLCFSFFSYPSIVLLLLSHRCDQFFCFLAFLPASLGVFVQPLLWDAFFVLLGGEQQLPHFLHERCSLVFQESGQLDLHLLRIQFLHVANDVSHVMRFVGGSASRPPASSRFSRLGILPHLLFEQRAHVCGEHFVFFSHQLLEPLVDPSFHPIQLDARHVHRLREFLGELASLHHPGLLVGEPPVSRRRRAAQSCAHGDGKGAPNLRRSDGRRPCHLHPKTAVHDGLYTVFERSMKDRAWTAVFTRSSDAQGWENPPPRPPWFIGSDRIGPFRPLGTRGEPSVERAGLNPWTPPFPSIGWCVCRTRGACSPSRYMKGTQVLLRETLSILRGVSDKRTGGLVWKTLARRRLSPEQKENQKRRRERQQTNAKVLREAAAAEPNGKE